MTSKNTLLIIMGICLVAGLLVTGCTQQAAPSDSSQVKPEWTEQNSKPSVVPTDAPVKPQLTQCPEGCRGEPPNPSLTICPEGCRPGIPMVTGAVGKPNDAPANIGMANPASVNCGKVGGNVEIKKDAPGNEYGMYTFTNGTTCEEWALFRGEGCKPNVAPTATRAK